MSRVPQTQSDAIQSQFGAAASRYASSADVREARQILLSPSGR